MSSETRNSFHGRLLEVDLTSGSTRVKTIPPDLIERYLGQKGLGARIFFEDVPPDADPLSPANELVFSTAVMTGTIVSCSAKLAITTKSPITGTISDGSVGGHVGAELKYAGYDALVVKGRAPGLSYLYLDPDKAEIRDAAFLKGEGTFRTDTLLKEKTGDEELKILAIGPAGENLVPFACVSSERYRQLGRGGIGAVFGSKNLKAVVIKGWLPVHVPDMDACMKTAAEAHERDNVVNPEYEIYTDGTPVLVNMANESGLLPTRNFSAGRFEQYENINTTAFKAVRRAKKACFSCGIACGNYVVDGAARVEGPEFETIALLGSSIGNGDRQRLIELNALCDDLGLDTISTGGILAWMMEMTEKGLKDFGIRFGEGDKAAELIRSMALKQGPGAEAALGTKVLSEKYGGKDFAMHIKGLELPGYDPRG
ncbi:MAG: aldehyde ferredoxin oxidoreductase, partial [Spirochaetales bacterium]